MKAVAIYEHGGPEVLKYVDIPCPVPGYGEALVKIRAIGMNYNDLWSRKGLPGMRFKLPHIPGTDVAGEIVDVGPGVTKVRPGDKVVVTPTLSCRKCAACWAGQEYFCKHFKVWGFQTGPLDGGYAEYAKLPEDCFLTIGDSIGLEEAAMLPACLATAWHMLVGRARVQPGEDVLIWGATGGVGIYAIQIAKLFGARVIAVAGSDEKLETAKRLGADHLINYNTQEVFLYVRRITGKRGVDVVFEHTGVATWETSIRCMKPGARLVTCGNTTGFDAKLDLRALFWNQLSLLGCHTGSKAEIMEAWRFVASGQIKPVIGARFALSESAEAHRCFEEGRKVGKILIVPEHN